MTADAPNVNTLWGRALVEELVVAGVSAACLAPGSRSTPLTLAFLEHDGVDVIRLHPGHFQCVLGCSCGQI